MIVRTIATLLFVCLFFTGTAFAKPLVVLTETDFAPYSMVREGKPAGIDVDVFAEAANRVGIEYELEVVPWVTLLSRLQKGECDMAFSLFYVPERTTYASFVKAAPIHKSDYGLFTLVSRNIQRVDVRDLEHMTIGRPEEFSIGERFDDAEKAGKLKTISIPGEAEMVARLLSGKLDAFVGQIDVVQYVLKRMGMQSTVVQVDPTLEKERPAYLVVSNSVPDRERENLVSRFNKALTAIVQDGTYSKIARRYLLRF